MNRTRIFACFAVLVCLVVPFRCHAQLRDCNHISLAVSVVDREGEFIPFLEPSRFEVKVGGKPARIEDAKSGFPSKIVLLLESSPAVVARKDIREFQLRLAYFLATSAPDSSSVAMVVFGDKIDAVLQDRKSIERELTARLNGNDPPSGKAAVLATVQEVMAGLTSGATGDVLILLNGMSDREPKELRMQVREALLNRGVRLFSISLEPNVQMRAPGFIQSGPVQIGTQSVIYPKYFGTGASAPVPYISGGFMFHINFDKRLPQPSASEWKQTIVSTIYRHYLLTLSVASAPAKEANTEISVLTPEGKKAVDAYSIGPRVVQPCAVNKAR